MKKILPISVLKAIEGLEVKKRPLFTERQQKDFDHWFANIRSMVATYLLNDKTKTKKQRIQNERYFLELSKEIEAYLRNAFFNGDRNAIEDILVTYQVVS